jgi:hypothetical protein
MKLALALTCTLALITPSQAQTVQRQAQVWRCGPDGRDLRDAPCPGAGAASSVTFDDPSPADRRAAQERHRADARAAAELASDRRASDAQARRQRALILGPLGMPAPQPTSSPAAASAPSLPHAKPPPLARPHKPAAPPKTNASAASRGR